MSVSRTPGYDDSQPVHDNREEPITAVKIYGTIYAII